MSMELDHSFTVPVPPEQAWDVLLDVAKVAPCMPGAQVDTVDGDGVPPAEGQGGTSFADLQGDGLVQDRDESDRSVLVEASGKEMRGSGTAWATVRAALRPENGSSPASATVVTLHTTLNVTGRPAQFGRGVITEVGSRLIDKFADNLAQQLASGAVFVPAPDGGATASASAAAPAPPTGEATAPPAPSPALGPTLGLGPSPGRPASACLPHLPAAPLPPRLHLLPHLAGLHRHARPAHLRRHIHRSGLRRYSRPVRLRRRLHPHRTGLHRHSRPTRLRRHIPPQQPASSDASTSAASSDASTSAALPSASAPVTAGASAPSASASSAVPPAPWG